MINPLAISTRGRITNSVKRTLTLGVIGWLVIVGSPSNNDYARRVYIEDDGAGKKNILDEHIKRLLQEDEEILAIVQVFTKSQL